MKAELYESECEQELLKRCYGKVPNILDAQEAYANWGNKTVNSQNSDRIRDLNNL